jgi:predicted cupin superfamily sugar epimerase
MPHMPPFDRPSGRAGELVQWLGLQPHPEGGYFREVFRSTATVQPGDARPARQALTTIDFLLAAGQFSAWHRVDSDEVWHLLEGARLRLWLMPPSLDRVIAVDLDTASAVTAPRHVVERGWWQAAEPCGEFCYTAATVGPGFEFADFSFMREHEGAREALQRLQPDLTRLL